MKGKDETNPPSPRIPPKSFWQRFTRKKGKGRSLSTSLLSPLLLLLFLSLTSSGYLSFLPYNTTLDHIAQVILEKEGLRYLSYLLEKGLEQAEMRRAVVAALEDQVFYVLVPNFGGYAKITVDYGRTSAYPEKDGFRYDQVAVTVDSIPATNDFPTSSGVLYPILFLDRYSQGQAPDYLPELHVRIEYPLLPLPVSAIAYGRVTGYAFLTASLIGGQLKGYIQDFTTRIQDFKVGFPNGDTGVIIEALSEILIRDWRNELEDALSSVLKSGINSILFDRDGDGNPDPLLDLSTLIASLNTSLGSNFVPELQGTLYTNITEPSRVVLDLKGSFVENEVGGCVGPDASGGFRYTLWEQDGASGHDPPPLSVVSPRGNRYQVAVALSDDFLNEVLFNAYRTGLGCVFISPDSPLLPPEVRSLMNVRNLALLGLPWLGEIYPPQVSFGVELRIAQAPYLEFSLPGLPYEIHLHLPDVSVGIYLLLDDRWFRLMATRGSLDLFIHLEPPKAATELFSLSLASAVNSEVTFSELYPDKVSDFATVLPQATSLLSDLLKGPLADLQKTLLSCLPGISVQGMELAPLGADEDLGLSHYFGLWVSFQGELNLQQFLTQCLFGGGTLLPSARGNP